MSKASSARRRASLQREIDIYAKLQYSPCEHVLGVIDTERDERFVSLIIELADGGDLKSHVEEQPPKRLPLTDALGVALQVARGIAELHELSIVHRDLKPENVLRSGGRWKLADFGIAKSQRNAAAGVTFQHAGTYGYAAPEQFEGTQAEPSADVYSFGKMLVFLLTGTTDLDRVPLEYTAARKLARQCAALAAETRPTIDEVIKSLEQLAEVVA
jgi:serine/threonine protein kinase